MDSLLHSWFYGVGIKLKKKKTKKEMFNLDNLLVGYVDSDYASDLNKRRSTDGYLFIMVVVPICWRSTL